MRSLCVFVLLSILLLVAPTAHGQPTDTTALPEIAPREIEIRSEREIALPALERQPLTGFVQAPTVPAVPADRAPYVGSYTYPLDRLPQSLPLPTPSPRAFRAPVPPTKGSLEGGTGRSFNRFFEGRVQHPLSATTRLSAHGTYRGTEAAPDDDVAEARLQLHRTAESVTVDGALYGRAQRYALHGARPQPPDSLDTTLRREGTLAGGSVEVHTNAPLLASATAQYEHASYASTLGRAVPDSTFTQQQFVLQGEATLPVWLQPRLEATYRRSWLGGDPARETAFDLHAAGTVSLIDHTAATLRVGGATLAYETPAVPTRSSIGTADATYVAPVVEAEWRVRDAVRLYARTQPQLGTSSLEALSATNSYTEYAPSLRPSLETTHADAGLAYTPGPVRIVAEAGYRYAPTYRYFTQRPDGLFDVRYDAARILEGRAEVALQGRRGVQASLSMTVRDARLPTRDADVPNMATVTADAMVAVSVADGDGTLTAHGHVAGPRDAHFGPTAPRLDALWSLDLEADYAITSRIDLLARAHNVSDEAPVRWAGYPRAPAQFSAGLRLHW